MHCFKICTFILCLKYGFSLSVLALGLASVTRKIATSKKVLLFVTLLSMHTETAFVYSKIGTVQGKGTVHITNEQANHSCTQCKEKNHTQQPTTAQAWPTKPC